MKTYTKLTLLSCILLFFYNSTLFAQDFDTISIVESGAKLIQVSNQFKFTEGPSADKNGNIFFTDQPNNKIWKYDINGQLSVFLEETGRSNGLFFDKKGNLFACADDKNELWKISKDGSHSVVLDNFMSKKFNGPNDLWIDKKGGIFFTDPYYQRVYWSRKKAEMDAQRVYYLPKGQKQAIIVEETLKQPNGIVGSKDGKNLFVADIKDNKTYKYDIGENGKLLNRVLFVPQGSDGMEIDNAGNLYLTGKGVTIYNQKGEKIGKIPVPSNWVGNICFGGKNRNILLITASESVYTLKMNVKGIH